MYSRGICEKHQVLKDKRVVVVEYKRKNGARYRGGFCIPLIAEGKCWRKWRDFEIIARKRRKIIQLSKGENFRENLGEMLRRDCSTSFRDEFKIWGTFSVEGMLSKLINMLRNYYDVWMVRIWKIVLEGEWTSSLDVCEKCLDSWLINWLVGGAIDRSVRCF